MVASEQLNSNFLIIKMQNYHRTGNMNTNHHPPDSKKESLLSEAQMWM